MQESENEQTNICIPAIAGSFLLLLTHQVHSSSYEEEIYRYLVVPGMNRILENSLEKDVWAKMDRDKALAMGL